MDIPVQIVSHRKQISAILSLPLHSCEYNPVVVMCYGLNGDRSDVHRIACEASREMNRWGIACIRFDYRGQGVSDGDFIDVSIRTKKEDIIEVIKYIRGCYFQENCKVILIGFSDGAKITSLVAEQCEEVEAVILWNPIFGAEKRRASLNEKKRLFKVGNEKKLAIPFLCLWLSIFYLREMNEYNYVDKYNNYSGKKVIIKAKRIM